jgi:hypothetical protein
MKGLVSALDSVRAVLLLTELVCDVFRFSG